MISGAPSLSEGRDEQNILERVQNKRAICPWMVCANPEIGKL